ARLDNILRHLRIPMVFRVEIDHRHARAVLDFTLAQIMQMALPVAVLLEIFSHMLGDKNVARVTAIHHSLRNVDSSPRNVGPTTYVHHAAHRSAMNSHA